MNKKLAWGLGIGALLVTGIGVAVYVKRKKNKQDKLDAEALKQAQSESVRIRQQETRFGTPVNTNNLDLSNIMSGIKSITQKQVPTEKTEKLSYWDYEKDMPKEAVSPFLSSFQQMPSSQSAPIVADDNSFDFYEKRYGKDDIDYLYENY